MTLQQKSSQPMNLFTLQIIAAALTGSVALLIVVAYFIPFAGEKSAYDPALHGAILGVGVMTLVSSFLLEKIFVKHRVESVSKENRTLSALLQGFLPSITVSFALRESAAIMGFVVSMLTGDPIFVVIMGGVTMAVNILSFPTKSRVNAYLPPAEQIQ
ncbi:MAG: hypothetical protein KDD64_01430 [Bdellovibrionales bacterium]|nr:hypothetical protein [Bdellovibrionales bacterium]